MFVVAWTEDAFDDMQRLLSDHPDLRTDLTYFIRQLVRELGEKAHELGESRNGDERVYFLKPVWALFAVDEDTMTAEILALKLQKRKK